jgi:hypothetical protein
MGDQGVVINDHDEFARPVGIGDAAIGTLRGGKRLLGVNSW